MGRLGTAGAVSSIVASMVGAGILALPQAVAKSGLLSGIIVSLLLGFVLFTVSGLALARACELCEELDELEQRSAGQGTSNIETGGAGGSSARHQGDRSKRVLVRRETFHGTSNSLFPTLDGPASGGAAQQQAEDLTVVDHGEAGGNTSDVDLAEPRSPRCVVTGGQPVLDGLGSSEPVVELRSTVVEEEHESSTGKVRRSSIVSMSRRKIYLYGDVAEKAFFGKKWVRHTFAALGSVNLMFACSIFLLLMGDAVQQFMAGARLFGGNYDVYTKGPSKSVWLEAIVFTGLMMALVQLPDVGAIARISFLGTGAAMSMCILFVLAPIILHAGSKNGLPVPYVASLTPYHTGAHLPAGNGHELAQAVASGKGHAELQKVPGLKEQVLNQKQMETLNLLETGSDEALWSSPTVAHWSSSSGKQGAELLNTNGVPSLFVLEKIPHWHDTIKAILDSFSTCGFGFGFAAIVPIVRADMGEPGRISRVIVIAVSMTMIMYVLVIITGLLGIGQKNVLAYGTITAAFRGVETMVRVKGYDGQLDAAQIEQNIQQLKTQYGAETVLDAQPRFFVLPVGANANANSPPQIRTYIFLLLKNQAYFLRDGKIGKASIMVFILVILLAMKLIISYPLTLWPVIQDFEAGLAGSTCMRRCVRRQPRDGPGSFMSTHSGTEAEEQTPLFSGENADLVGSRTSSRLSVSTNSATTWSAPSKKKLICAASVVTRVIAVAVTFLLAAVFGCQPCKLDAVMGLAASVPGILAFVIFPLVAYQLLSHQMRQKKNMSLSGKDVAEMCLHGFLCLVSVTLLIYTCIVTPGRIYEVFSQK
ncbi:unnamed protein product [Amoebophrya sp. A25]|nr:unnamed protein product [Amoebophrya sp. A25]|eukprot:GSA25T00008054001.1